MLRIGIDVGGTFTDFTALDERTGGLRFFKLLSTPSDPSDAIEAGLRALLADSDARPEDVTYVGHGTTVATNIVIERRGARIGLVTTRGFRDVLELGRQARPSIYDYRVAKPPPLVPRDLRFEVDERTGPAGEMLRPLDVASLDAAVEALVRADVESVVVCFLHSYRSPENERVAKAAVARALPHAHVTVSSDILPEFREFERLSTATVNAFVGPRMSRYMARLKTRVAAIGIAVEPYTFHSNGGLMSIDAVCASPVRTCVSGPAAGVVGAAEIGRVAGVPDLVTFDVGGTSTDVSLIAGARPLRTSARLVAGYPVKVPMLDIHVIGAGGGSIAAIDAAGALKVGPRSAGAEPGPVAYGRGGMEPTITDANLCLGRLDPGTLLGGRLRIDLEAARDAVRTAIAAPLGLSLEEAAHGIIQIANAAMSRAIRSVSVEKGYDVTRFALCAFGGAGPLHAIEVAAECAIPRVVVPQEPGTLCARGMLLSDLSTDYVRSHLVDASSRSWTEMLALFAAMEADGDAWLAREGIASADRQFHRVLDARYRGQNFEVKVDCDGVGRGDLGDVETRFHAAHSREYGYAIAGRPIEFVSARVQAIGVVPKAPQPHWTGGASLAGARIGERSMYADRARGWTTASVYTRAALPAGIAIPGPAIIEEMSATTLVLPDWTALVDPWGNLLITGCA